MPTLTAVFGLPKIAWTLTARGAEERAELWRWARRVPAMEADCWNTAVDCMVGVWDCLVCAGETRVDLMGMRRVGEDAKNRRKGVYEPAAACFSGKKTRLENLTR